MILFTSDLDRTIIYSKSMMDNFPVQGEMIPVEYKGEQIITFMSEASINLIKEFNEKHMFIPVTTRALYQYKRIHVLYKELQPKYAIVSNGGTILVDGKVDITWNEQIKRKVEATSFPKEDMLKEFSRIRHEKWVLREFYIDNFFYMFHVDKKFVPHVELKFFEAELKKLGWRMYLHGKKLYILPCNLSKAHAVKWLQNYLDYDIHVAAGDSLMDYDMIAESNIGYSPIHGELFQLNPTASKVNWLNKKGAGFTEELLSILLHLNDRSINVFS